MQKMDQANQHHLSQKEVILFAIVSGAILVGCTIAADQNEDGKGVVKSGMRGVSQ